MQHTSFKRNYSDIRRLLHYPINHAGHFYSCSVQLPGKLNNHWTAIFNIKNNKVISLYRIRNSVCIIMARSKSPYHALIADQLRREGVKLVLWRKIPKTANMANISSRARGWRVQTKQERVKANKKLQKAVGATEFYDPRAKVTEARTKRASNAEST